MIELDGSHGEGGGQILRTALALSMASGQPFTIRRIRARRAKPGLMRQHLTGVNAAAAICGATVQGAHLGSTELQFTPGAVQAGDYQFAIGSAGSCTLVLQTILPALLLADKPSCIRVQGGTHNPAAPPASFLQHSFLPLLQRMGPQCTLELKRWGFYPAGGGELQLDITPCATLTPLHLETPGQLLEVHAEAVLAAVSGGVGLRELAAVREQLQWPETAMHMNVLPQQWGPGNVLLLSLRHSEVTEVFCGFGEHGTPAEQVAARTCHALRRYQDSGAAVGEHLADQLLLPLALAGAGSFTTHELSSHTRTNAEVIEKFLPLEFTFTRVDDKVWRVALAA